MAKQQAKEDGEQVSHVYSHALKGYAATIPDNKLAAVRDPLRPIEGKYYGYLIHAGSY